MSAKTDLRAHVEPRQYQLDHLCQLQGRTIAFMRSEDGCQVYDVDLERCRTPEAILEQIDHLTDKTWITRDHIKSFINVATNYHNIRIRPI